MRHTTWRQLSANSNIQLFTSLHKKVVQQTLAAQLFYKYKCKGKVIPSQARCGPEGG